MSGVVQLIKNKNWYMKLVPARKLKSEIEKIQVRELMPKEIRVPIIKRIDEGNYLVTVYEPNYKILANGVDQATALKVKKEYIKKQIKKSVS